MPRWPTAFLRSGDGAYRVIEAEGGYVDFAPLDALEDRMVAELRKSFRRVSVERLVSGRGLMNIYSALGAIERRPIDVSDEKALWAAAMDGSDPLAAAALDRLCLCFGAVTGDLALAHGASAVIIGGGLGLQSARLGAQSPGLTPLEVRVKGPEAPSFALKPTVRRGHREIGVVAAELGVAGEGASMSGCTGGVSVGAGTGDAGREGVGCSGGVCGGWLAIDGLLSWSNAGMVNRLQSSALDPGTLMSALGGKRTLCQCPI